MTLSDFRSIFGIIFVLIIITGFTSVSFSEYSSPRVQLESGVLLVDIQCRDDRVLVIRANGSPACVTEITAEKTGWEIINTFEISATIQTTVEPNVPTTVELDVSSPVEFVDDGREYDYVLQKSPAPLNTYDRIMESMDDGVSVNSKGIATITPTSHEKYSLNTGVGFYAEDWLPSYIIDGQKLLYTETECYPSGYCGLGIKFVPKTFVLNQNVTNYDLQVSKGFFVGVKYNGTPLDEIEDMIEGFKEIRESQPGNYGGFREMTRDGKTVWAYEGGNKLNYYQAGIYFHIDEFTSLAVSSNYHTLDELIPIFESVMK